MTKEVQVYQNEGKIPHVHLNSKSNRKWHCCICLHTEKYFIHKGKTEILNSKQRNEFNNFMYRKPKIEIINGPANNWQKACNYWIINNGPNELLKQVLYQPDYNKLKDSIHDF